jgi:hypothetical protein
VWDYLMDWTHSQGSYGKLIISNVIKIEPLMWRLVLMVTSIQSKRFV